MKVWHWISVQGPDEWQLLGTRCGDCGPPLNDGHVRRVEAHPNDACDECGYPYDDDGEQIE